MVNVLNKPLPFKGKIPSVVTDDYQQVMKALAGSKAHSIVVDDAGYLITNYFMKNHSSKGAGNAIFSMYNTLADNFWNLIEFIKKLPDEKIVYIIMHEDTNDFGDIKPKTIGRLIDEKVCFEGLFSIVLRSKKVDKNYFFYTQSTDNDVAKSPMGMFNDLYIDNDLKMVDDTIREFYGIKGE